MTSKPVQGYTQPVERDKQTTVFVEINHLTSININNIMTTMQRERAQSTVELVGSTPLRSDEEPAKQKRKCCCASFSDCMAKFFDICDVF